MNVHQTIKTCRAKADKPLSSRHRVKLHGIVHCEAKKLHRFIFAIALSELHLL